MKTKVLITGGAGFIGGHIAERWLLKGAEVLVLDNFRSGRRENISELKGVKLIEGSVEDDDLVRSITRGVDYVHSLAALVSVPESIEKPLECVDINVKGLINLLEASRRNNIKKLIHSSSAAIYGDNPETPKKINSLASPKSPYGVTKLDGEYYCNIYTDNFGLKTVSLRYFNAFGPRQDINSPYAAVIPIFINKALKGEDIIVYGDGEQTRDFIYVKDVAEANILAALNEEVLGVFNIATGQAVSINQLLKIIIEETKSKSKIIHKKERVGDIKHSLADINDSLVKLNFKPRYNLIEGLKETIESVKKN